MTTLKEKRTNKSEGGAATKYAYRPVEQRLYRSELGHYTSYGIAAYRGEGGERVAFVADVTTDESFARRLADSFTEKGLAPIHLTDAIEDAIP